ncbi:MAG: hypothetical protein HGA36_05165 [Candidatus Moranbacteria bacterium]|nr:hypothetical protein [Candidatus Moranbacteria bacterium]
MNNKEKIAELPNISMIAEFLLALFIPLWVFVYMPLIIFSAKSHAGKYALMGLLVVVILFIIILIVVSKFKKIIYSSERIVLLSRYGKETVLIGSDIISVDYFEWLRVYVKNIDFEIQKEIENESCDDFPDHLQETRENMQKLMSGLSYYICPAFIKTKNGSRLIFIDENVLKQLDEIFGNSKAIGKKKVKYNENWNWLIFAFAIFGICFAFIYVLSHPG